VSVDVASFALDYKLN